MRSCAQVAWDKSTGIGRRKKASLKSAGQVIRTAVRDLKR